MKFLSQVTPEELKLVPHHLINILDPLQTNTVVDFRHRALPEVERLLREGKIPFICGGTNYYIESLLWKILVDQELPILGSRKRVNTEGEETSEGAIERKVSTENTLHNSSVESEGNPNMDRLRSINFEKDDNTVATRDLFGT